MKRIPTDSLSIDSDTVVIWMNVIIALVLVPFYYSLGEGLKFLVAPYVMYMMWSRNANYFPALVVHFLPGSTMSSFILTLCLILSVAYWGRLWRDGLGLILVSLMLPLPYFLYQTVERLTMMNASFVDTVVPLSSYYLGLFAFFYGALIATRVDEKVWRALLIVLFVLQLLSISGIYSFTVRYYFLSLPLFVVILFDAIYLKKHVRFSLAEKAMAISMVMMAISGTLGLTFTLVLASLLALAAVFFHSTRSDLALSFIAKPRVLVLLVLVVLLVAFISQGYHESIGLLRTERILTADDLWAYFEFKALGDRGALWRAGIEFFVSEKMFWPPLHVPQFSYVSSSGAVISEVEFGFHNLGLELARNYGIIVGALLAVVFVLMLTNGGRFLFTRARDKYGIAFTAAVLATGIAGSLAGQYPLQPTFSFFLLGTAGISYVKARKSQKRNSAGRWNERRLNSSGRP